MTTVLDVIIGAVTFSGSIIAAGKLQGVINSAPVTFPGARIDQVHDATADAYGLPAQAEITETEAAAADMDFAEDMEPEE